MTPLSREEFREACLSRDNHKCVFCGASEGIHVHHIIERRLFGERGHYGYFLNNGASVCEECHVKCETTEISIPEVLKACGIEKRILPEHFYDDQAIEYDKWGNVILENGRRLKGELFHDESVQKVLARGGKLDLFTPYVKYPRTYHLPWSASVPKDDKIIPSMDNFTGKRVIVTEKVDGENTSFYNDYIHARSLDGRNHPSRDWVKNFWQTFRFDIPDGWRVCGENLFAKHSIKYSNLPSYLLGFSVWNEYNECLSWDETLEWFQLLGIVPVKVLYDGFYDEAKIKSLWKPEDWDSVEGYVLRLGDKFSYRDFKTSVVKFVRNNHVQTVKHWAFGQLMERNEVNNADR